MSDTSELLEKSEKALFGVTQTFIQNKLVPIREILNNRYEEFAAIHADPELIQRNMISTGYKSFDEKLGGFKRGDLIIVAARPSMGKTAIALNFAQNVAKKNRHVAIFSLEMSKEQLTDRLIAAAMAVDSWNLQEWAMHLRRFRIPKFISMIRQQERASLLSNQRLVALKWNRGLTSS